MFGGIVAIEKLFGYPGIGLLILTAAQGRTSRCSRRRARHRRHLPRGHAARRPAHAVLNPRIRLGSADVSDKLPTMPARRPPPAAHDAVAPATSPDRAPGALRLLLRSKTFVVGASCRLLGRLRDLRRAIAPHDPIDDDPAQRARVAAADHRSASTGSAATSSRASSSARASIMIVAPAATLIGSSSAPCSGSSRLLPRRWSTTSSAASSTPSSRSRCHPASPCYALVAALGTRLTLALIVVSASSSRRSSRGPSAPPCSPSASSTTSRRRGCAASAPPYIMFAEILPNVTGPIIVEVTVRLGYAVFTVATLGFLGFGLAAALARLGPADRRALRRSSRSPGGPCCSRRSRSRSLVVAINLIADALSRCSSDERRERRSASAAALELRDLDVVYRVRGGDREVLRGVSLRSSRASPTGSSASPAAASRPSRSRSCATCRATARRGGHGRGRRPRRPRTLGRRRAAPAIARDAVSMVYQNPGTALNPSLRVGGRSRRSSRCAAASRGDGRDARARDAPRRCGSPTRTRCCAAIRTSSPAACSSAS